MRDRAVRFVFEGTDKNLAKTTANVTRHVGLLHAAFHRLGRGIELGAAIEVGRRAMDGLFEVVKGSVEAAEKAEKVNRLTEAVIRSTGGVAHVSAAHVAGYATSLSNLTGVNREQIQSNENLLLTFTDVRNGVGKGNDIFDQATLAVSNMSAALGQDGKSSAIQLGKALQDPIHGATALKRVGVNLSDQLKAQIKVLVEHGHKMAAQKLILHELTTEFGGAAAAVATPFERLKNTFHNIEVQLGQALLPAFNVVLGLLGRALPGAIHGLTTTFGRLVPLWRSFIQGFRSPGGDVVGTGLLASMIRFGQAVRRFVDDNGPKVRVFFGHLLDDAKAFATRNGPTLIHVLGTAGHWFGELAKAVGVVVGWLAKHQTLVQTLAVVIGTVVAGLKVWSAVTKTVTAITKGFAVAQGILNAVMDANPIGIVVIAIAALAAGLIYAYKHSKTFRTIVDGTFKAIKVAVGTAINFIIGMFKAWFDTTANVVLGILHVFGKLPGPMGAPFRKAEQAVKDAKKTVDDQLGKIQKRVDKLTGKDIPISASLKLNFSPSFTQKDWVDVRLAAGRMAGGGLLAGPGTATSDSIPLWGSRGEFMVNAAATSRWLPVLEWINADRKAAGGPIGQIGAETGAIDKLEAWGVGRRMSAGIDKLLSSGAMVGGSLGVWIAAALALTHSPPSWASRLAVLVRRESGGNPRAINLTDSNARAGHPSQGLAQTIPATFRAYHQSGTSWNILDPVANLAAALNYIKAVYGSIFNVQQANPNLPPRGYRSGAWNIAADQLAVLHRGEMVVPAPAAAAVRARGARGGAGLPAIVQNFYVAGDLDQAAAARVERHVDAKMRELYRTLVAA